VHVNFAEVRDGRIGVPVKRILLMDDSPLFLDVARLALRSAGYDVICARDFAELQNLRKQGDADTDLVLMDVQMPEASGDDIALMMRHAYGIDAPIYLLSSLDDDELADRVEWAKVEGFISKNHGLEAVVREVKRILDGPPPDP
jgi:two-component system OmpR family response regulator